MERASRNPQWRATSATWFIYFPVWVQTTPDCTSWGKSTFTSLGRYAPTPDRTPPRTMSTQSPFPSCINHGVTSTPEMPINALSITASMLDPYSCDSLTSTARGKQHLFIPLLNRGGSIFRRNPSYLHPLMHPYWRSDKQPLLPSWSAIIRTWSAESQLAMDALAISKPAPCAVSSPVCNSSAPKSPHPTTYYVPSRWVNVASTAFTHKFRAVCTKLGQ